MPRSLQSISMIIIESEERMRMQHSARVRSIMSANASLQKQYMCGATYMNLKFTGDAIAICGHPSRCHRHGDGRGKGGP